MPELPEVETVRRGLVRIVIDKHVLRVVVNRFDLRRPVPLDFSSSVVGASLVDIMRRGKYMILVMDSGVHIVMHLGMSGRVRIYDRHHAYEARKHDHIIFYLDDDVCFVFEDPRRFGMVYVADARWYDEKPFSCMGPEPLDNWSGEDLYDAINTKKGLIKNVLLNQNVVAGLGNIYVCEALYYAKICPQRSAESLSRDECDRLVRASCMVLKDAIKSGGSTLRDYRHTDGGLGYFQHHFKVYGQAGGVCAEKTCHAKIAQITQSGRSTFYCPACQK